MTPQPPQSDWDDARLEAAFHARFDRPAPPTLTHDIHVRIAGTSPRRFAAPRFGQAWTVAAAAVVVVAVAGTALLGLGGLGLTGGPAPSASDGSTAASAVPSSAGATPTAQALPASVLGLPIIGIRDAIAVRDGGLDDTEIAVRGWFTPAAPTTCASSPADAAVSPVQLRCPDDLVWLTEDAESLVHIRSGVTTVDPPTGLAIHPYLDGLPTDWVTSLPEAGIDAGSTPTDVVFIGHFDDRRAALCPQAEMEACQDRFVVDSVAFAKGRSQPPSTVRMTDGAVSTEAEIAAVIANEAPDSPILSTVLVDGSTMLQRFEPALGTGQQGLIDRAQLWLVRVLEGGRAVTYVVIDGSDTIYEMNPNGEAILVGGEPPTAPPSRPTPSPAPWPPAGARVIELTSEVGAGDPPVQVAVIDHSGRLTGLSEKGAVDPSTQTLGDRFEAYPELEVSPGRVHLVWVGGICDRQITVTVSEDLTIIEFDMGPVVDCDSIGIERQLVLDFSGLVDVPSISVIDSTGGMPRTRPSAAPS